jgi:formate/nitrite transporter
MRETLYADPGPTASPIPAAVPGTYDGSAVLDFVRPAQVVQTMIETGSSKGELSVLQIILRGMLGGALLAYGTSMAFFGVAQGMIPILAALLFPLTFVVINILQVDLATGYFAYVPLAAIERRMSWGRALRAICWVYVGNLLGSLLYVFLLWSALTMTGAAKDTTGISAVLVKIGTLKTLHYEPFGAAGIFTAFIKGVLCNWFVTLGVVLPMASRSVIGKAIATFVPIYLFFGMGWEHLIVNMFIIPSAMVFGAPISGSSWWLTNEVPVTLGNFVGGFFFTGAAIGWIYRTRRVAA